MDRPLDQTVRRQRLTKRLGIGILVVGLVAIAYMTLSTWLRPTLHPNRMRTAVVEQGSIEATISASGMVVPAFEQVISSPINAQILAINQQPGATVEAGTPLVRLDVTALTKALQDLEDQLAIQANSQQQQQLQQEANLIDLRSRWAIQKLDVETLEKTLANNQKLLAQNLMSEKEVRASEREVEKARIVADQLEATLANAEAAQTATVEGMALEMTRLRRDYAEQQRALDEAAVHAKQAGVLTWVTPEVGATVRQGDVLARIADLSRFQVEVTVSDMHAERLRTGLPVYIRTGALQLEGIVTRVRPTVENGTLTVDVSLAEAAHEQLRPNLRVDAYIVTDERPETLRVVRGPFLSGDGHQQVFIVRNDRAIRTSVEVGLLSFDHAEILDGLQAGDRVITTDMSDYLHLESVEIR